MRDLREIRRNDRLFSQFVKEEVVWFIALESLLLEKKWDGKGISN